jgi:hypothetical protein
VKRVLFVLLIAGAVSYSVPGEAHHSFAATYFTDKTVTIEGRLVQLLFRNPHSFVHVEAPDQNGVVRRWGVEWGAINSLQGQGVSRETFKIGDHVVITGNPGRDSTDYRIRLVTITRPSDGLTWGGRPGERID